jgi:alginate O-acetyltransferase complex protein AlgJ
MTNTRTPRLADALFTAVFFALLLAPGVGMLAGFDPAPAPFEQRELAAAPGLPRSLADARRFAARFDSFLGDHFGFRNALIRTRNVLTVCGLDASPAPATATILGKQGWLFFVGDDSVPYIEGTNLMTAEQWSAWDRSIAERSEWLAHRGIRYLVVFAPAKASIYPEYLPDWVHPSKPGTRLDQILWTTSKEHARELLDLRGSLRGAKSHARLYQPTDTHWNDIGAYLAYAAIMERLSGWFPSAAAIPVGRFRMAWVLEPGGDLAYMLDIQGFVHELQPFLALPPPPLAHVVPSGVYATWRHWPKLQEPVVTERPGAEIGKVVVFRDSFSNALVPFLSRHFRRAVYLWLNGFDTRVIEREKPDLVIQEYAERMLSVIDPANPPALKREVEKIQEGRQQQKGRPR